MGKWVARWVVLSNIFFFFWIFFILTIRNSERFLNISHTHCIEHLEQLWKATFPGGNPDLCYHLNYPYSPSVWSRCSSAPFSAITHQMSFLQGNYFNKMCCIGFIDLQLNWNDIMFQSTLFKIDCPVQACSLTMKTSPTILPVKI